MPEPPDFLHGDIDALGRTILADMDAAGWWVGSALVDRYGITPRRTGPNVSTNGVSSNGHRPGTPEPSLFVDWPAFWQRETSDALWLIDDVFALGRAHAIYASHKAGKSYFVLWTAAKLATERSDVDVVYLDYEMTADDLDERLSDFGYGPQSDLSRLHYALLPSLPPLDTHEGAAGLLDCLQATWDGSRHLFAVFDTTSRATVGEENSNDTIRNFYRHTGMMLKRLGVTWVRLDHAGKDPAKGQRGGSAKGDDVDVVWHLYRTDNHVTLKRELSRLSYVPEAVSYTTGTQPPIAFERDTEPVDPDVAETVDRLDRLNVPTAISVREAGKILREAGFGKRTVVISKAMKVRRETRSQIELFRGESETPGNGGSE